MPFPSTAGVAKGRGGALLALLGAMLSVQLGAAFSKALFPMVGAAGASSVRVCLGALILAAAVRPWRGGALTGGRAVLLGYGLSLGAMNLVFYLALERIPLGLAVGLEFLGPLGLALLGSRRPRDLAFAGLAAAGVWLLLGLSPVSRIDPAGALLALAAGAFWALYIVFGARAGKRHGARAVALGGAIAAVLVLPFGAASAGPRILQPHVLLLGLMVALLSSAIPYLLEMIALRRLPSRVFGILMSGEPAVAALMGYFLLREGLAPVQVLGLAAIMVASLGAAAAGEGPPPKDAV